MLAYLLSAFKCFNSQKEIKTLFVKKQLIIGMKKEMLNFIKQFYNKFCNRNYGVENYKKEKMKQTVNNSTSKGVYCY